MLPVFLRTACECAPRARAFAASMPDSPSADRSPWPNVDRKCIHAASAGQAAPAKLWAMLAGQGSPRECSCSCWSPVRSWCPSLGERRIEERLTEGGGSADVTLGAIPAARLLFGDGERFEVSARDLASTSTTQRAGVLERLDGFSIVDVAIASSKAGPIEIERFELTRDAPGPYHLDRQRRDLAELAGRLRARRRGACRRPACIGPLVRRGRRPADSTGAGRARHGADLRRRPRPGRLRRRHVAGIPTGPLAELITTAVVVRL